MGIDTKRMGVTRRIDWYNLRDVIEYARSLGKGYVVFKDPQSPIYGVTHRSNHALLKRVKILYRI